MLQTKLDIINILMTLKGQNSQAFRGSDFYLEFDSSECQLGAILLPREHLAMFRDTSDCHGWGRGGVCFQHPVNKRTETLLNTLQCNRQSPMTKNHPAKNINSAKVEKLFYCKVYRRRQWHPTPVLLPGKSHGWRSLVGCSPWGP